MHHLEDIRNNHLLLVVVAEGEEEREDDVLENRHNVAVDREDDAHREAVVDREDDDRREVDGDRGGNSSRQILVGDGVWDLEEYRDGGNSCKTRDYEEVEEDGGSSNYYSNYHNIDRNTGRFVDARDFVTRHQALPHGERFCDGNLDENRI